MCIDAYICACMDMCRDMNINVCIGMHISICIGMRIDMCIDMRVSKRAHMRIGTVMDAHMDMCARMHMHMHQAALSIQCVICVSACV